MAEDAARRESLGAGEGKRSFMGLNASDVENCTRLVVRVEGSGKQLKKSIQNILRTGGAVRNIVSVGPNSHFIAFELSPDHASAFGGLQEGQLLRNAKPATRVEASYIPNDPFWTSQWGPQKIAAPAAWDVTLGSSSVLVAIIDTGIDYTHPDLAPNYVSCGYDWINNDTDPMDDNGHGTHCAGIVAADIGNGIGIAGLAQVHIMAEKVLGSDGWGWDTTVAAGIIHATDCGAKIISMSLGGPEWSDLMYEAVQYASQHDVVVIAAAGNSGNNEYHYPAAYEEAIAVSATDQSDNLAYFSTYGEWIDISAPGVDIYSTYLGNSYMSLQGTSMACPHVAGVAALVRSQFPECNALQVRRILEQTADDLGNPGFDSYFGHGRVNARKALSVPKHDLSVLKINHPRRVDPGQACTFNVTVGNCGRRNETGIVLSFYANGSLRDSASIPFLEALSIWQSLPFSMDTTVAGTYQIEFRVAAVPGDANTTNNAMSCSLMARPPTNLTVPRTYPTIRSALDHMGSGDSVLVNEGVYDEGVIDITEDNITLTASGIVVLDGTHVFNIINLVANYVTIRGFDFKYCPSFALNMMGRGNAVIDNYFIDNRECISLHDSSFCCIVRNFVHTHSGGLYIRQSANCTISQNRIVANSFEGGIHLISSVNNTVSFNSVTGVMRYALELSYSSNNILLSNTLTGNQHGIVLNMSPHNKLRQNAMIKNWCNFAPMLGPLPYWWGGYSDVDASNTVDGKPIYYWANVSDKTVPTDAGCVVLANCQNITLRNLELRDDYCGILLINSSDILITECNVIDNGSDWISYGGGVLSDDNCRRINMTLNNITGNTNGVNLRGLNHNISLNTIADNFHVGVWLFSYSILNRNNITGNNKCGAYIMGQGSLATSNSFMSNLGPSLNVQGSNHTIFMNDIIANGRPFENIYGVNHDGICVDMAANCTIEANNVVGCDDWGIHIYMSTGNKIFHNNFANCSKGLLLNRNNWSSSILDDGYPSGGNYWSTYTGTDDDLDGIGDTPYVLAVNHTDRYPLIAPYTGNPLPTIFTLTINGRVGSGPMEGFYDTSFPRPGIYFFAANSTARIDVDYYRSVTMDHFELDGVNIGSGECATVFMDSDHNLTTFLSVLPPLNVQISPTAASTLRFGGSVSFDSTVLNGKLPYEYVWLINGREVFSADSATWLFEPKQSGIFEVQLLVRYSLTAFQASQNVTVTVMIAGDVDSNFVVNILDVVRITSIYGSTLGDSSFKVESDIDYDGRITILDVVICTSHYGETGP